MTEIGHLCYVGVAAAQSPWTYLRYTAYSVATATTRSASFTWLGRHQLRSCHSAWPAAESTTKTQSSSVTCTIFWATTSWSRCCSHWNAQQPPRILLRSQSTAAAQHVLEATWCTTHFMKRIRCMSAGEHPARYRICDCFIVVGPRQLIICGGCVQWFYAVARPRFCGPKTTQNKLFLCFICLRSKGHLQGYQVLWSSQQNIWTQWMSQHVSLNAPHNIDWNITVMCLNCSNQLFISYSNITSAMCAHHISLINQRITRTISFAIFPMLPSA